jgi:dTDP-4-dehydrorhamnose 3,5-epimerase
MNINRFNIDGPAEIIPRQFPDSRGYFSEVFNLKSLQDAGIDCGSWVQDNQSYSEKEYTLRGLHLQLAPSAQAKLVRVLSGSIFDVAVDLRGQSKTYGQWIGVTLSASKFNQLYVPQGFAHGFLTLEPHVNVQYKVNNHYSKEAERALRWDDVDLAINWPLPEKTVPLVSDKDAIAPLLNSVARGQWFD